MVSNETFHKMIANSQNTALFPSKRLKCLRLSTKYFTHYSPINGYSFLIEAHFLSLLPLITFHFIFIFLQNFNSN